MQSVELSPFAVLFRRFLLIDAPPFLPFRHHVFVEFPFGTRPFPFAQSHSRQRVALNELTPILIIPGEGLVFPPGPPYNQEPHLVCIESMEDHL